MFLWGSIREKVWLGDPRTEYCSLCDCVQPFSLVLVYDYSHFLTAFGMLTHREYWMLCDVCEHGEKLKRDEVERYMTRLPIPFMHRHGLLILLIPAALAYLTAMTIADVMKMRR